LDIVGFLLCVRPRCAFRRGPPPEDNASATPPGGEKSHMKLQYKAGIPTGSYDTDAHVKDA